ncbi:hypothetical protein TMatcc_007653 [Talaromyces marneffei ATCC 18224]|uniref:DRBM domain-containing protein n=1 Tax=Talaromyces marneffei (strain ATCC 18224 / CBS 334.59 / QM 7333) TaxID=441960 RepID=B6QGG5_TALMQ|nr:uncharacterized protein EYB26_004590 [Talaromyces marneffei]EEA24550.1 conserved hypothetical protein [Talaromyces marneffei ATCC 18224]KAE8552948.1 hypothetical protein EYB25_004327 [Talaromyces marneffei]QGA16920.1 hypothetical protein EYB26_004590 [Talaromyces marneffei]
MSTSTAGGQGAMPNWQKMLGDHCSKNGLAAPEFHIVSDRRGGRTAWSATVNVGGGSFAARYWYDGQYLNNAKEDAAEVAIRKLDPQPFVPQTNYSGQF